MLLLKNFYILNPCENTDKNFAFYPANLWIKNGKIEKIEPYPHPPLLNPDHNLEIIDGQLHQLIFPGFIQTHIHFCQTLHRNRAEQMPLLHWLKNEIWPYEASLTPQTIGKSVMMSIQEILRSGTTAVLDMGTVSHQEIIFEIMQAIGFRYTGGKAMMDQCPDAPPGLQETTDHSIKKSMALIEKFHGKNDHLLHYAFAPRFVLSCSHHLLKEVRHLSDQYQVIVHTHASEHPDEVEYIRQTTGFTNLGLLHHIGALNPQCVIAHLVHTDTRDREYIRDYPIFPVHCPSTNLKLGSGIAPIPAYLEAGFHVGLGCDGAPCNNSLSIFNEIKLASLLQKGIHNDPIIFPPQDALRMVSLHGAHIIRQSDHIGKIQEQMDADLVILDMDTPQTYNFEKNPAAAIVYGADARNVIATMVKGQFLYRDHHFSPIIQELIRRYP